MRDTPSLYSPGKGNSWAHHMTAAFGTLEDSSGIEQAIDEKAFLMWEVENALKLQRYPDA